MSNDNGSNGELDPIELQRRAQRDAMQTGAALAGALHTMVINHTHADVINACLIVAGARAKMMNMRRADFRTQCGQVFDGIELGNPGAEPARAGLAVP